MSNSNDPPLCATGCGFYGSAAQQNMCSKCFRDSQKIAATVQLEEQPCTTPNTNINDVVGVSDESGGDVKTIRKKNRCSFCDKRVGLTGFECKCGEVYCGSHRHPEKHSCQFDFKNTQREVLSKALYSASECVADRLHNRID